jgi:hypothetical protein
MSKIYSLFSGLGASFFLFFGSLAVDAKSETFYGNQRHQVDTMTSFLIVPPNIESNTMITKDLRDEINGSKQEELREDSCAKLFRSQTSFGGDSIFDLSYRVVGNVIYFAPINGYSNICSRSWEKKADIGIQFHDVVNGGLHPGYPKIVYHRENGELCRYFKGGPDYSVDKRCYKYKQY